MLVVDTLKDSHKVLRLSLGPDWLKPSLLLLDHKPLPVIKSLPIYNYWGQEMWTKYIYILLWYKIVLMWLVLHGGQHDKSRREEARNRRELCNKSSWMVGCARSELRTFSSGENQEGRVPRRYISIALVLFIFFPTQWLTSLKTCHSGSAGFLRH